MSKFLAFDISTNTGYALFERDRLIDYGVFTIKVPGYKSNIKTYEDFPCEYPLNFLETAESIAGKCVEIIEKLQVSRIVVEHPEGAKQRISQRLLEWTHFALMKRLQGTDISFKYILVNDWRHVVKCYMKHWPLLREHNAKVRKAKKTAEPTKSGAKRAKIDGKIVAPINQKKLSVMIANEKYGVQTKDDNIADAINIGRAAFELGLMR